MPVSEISWHVTGYHEFRVKPAVGEHLTLVKDKNNPVDKYAILIKRADGTVVGRVPANFCRAITKAKL